MPRSPGPLLLLDTHVWLWLLRGLEGTLPPSIVTALRRASRDGAILVSILSVWEAAMFHARGRMRITISIDEWVERGLRAPGIRLIELSPEVAIESTRLPGSPHRDPVDRILVATARRTGAQLVTRDQRILAYARSGHLSVVDATP